MIITSSSLYSFRRIFGEEGYAMQQGILEMADFHMFLKKMDNVKLTKGLQRFLQRMDLFK